MRVEKLQRLDGEEEEETLPGRRREETREISRKDGSVAVTIARGDDANMITANDPREQHSINM